MSLRPWGKYVAAGVSSAVLAAGLSFVAPPANAATAPSPDAAAISWLTQQLGSDNLVNGDLGTTIDFGTALAGLNGSQATLDRIKSAVDAGVGGYVIGDGTDGVNAAQAAVFYDSVGVDPTTVDGNLVAKVEAATDDSTGMVKAQYGYEGGWSQALGVRALVAGDSSEASTALNYLLGMQCASGGWSDTTCSYAADPDDTADALFALFPMQGTGNAAVDDAITRGVSALAASQKADGGFDPSWGENASSTGLAAQALAAGGRTAAAQKAAVWLRAHQIAGSPCDGKLSGDGGAVGYTYTVIANGAADGIAADSGAKYDWFNTSIQSFPALVNAPAATGGRWIDTPSWAKAGSTVKATAKNLAAGQRGCLSIAGKNLTVIGGGITAGSFTYPTGTKNRTAVLRVTGSSVTKTVFVLAPKTLKVTAGSARVAKGGKERITVSGLHAGEAVRLKYKGVVVAKGLATSTGTFTRRISVGRTAGAKTVYAFGRFTTRKGHVGFTVR
ncbi:prenyltransferase/squalene oxidase repeat-containing protein [Nocardioides montaniterrae]